MKIPPLKSGAQMPLSLFLMPSPLFRARVNFVLPVSQRPGLLDGELRDRLRLITVAFNTPLLFMITRGQVPVTRKNTAGMPAHRPGDGAFLNAPGQVTVSRISHTLCIFLHKRRRLVCVHTGER